MMANEAESIHRSSNYCTQHLRNILYQYKQQLYTKFQVYKRTSYNNVPLHYYWLCLLFLVSQIDRKKKSIINILPIQLPHNNQTNHFLTTLHPIISWHPPQLTSSITLHVLTTVSHHRSSLSLDPLLLRYQQHFLRPLPHLHLMYYYEEDDPYIIHPHSRKENIVIMIIIILLLPSPPHKHPPPHSFRFKQIYHT